MEQRDKIITGILIFVLIGSMVAAFITYSQYRSTFARDVALRKQMEQEKAELIEGQNEKYELRERLQKLEPEIADLQTKIYLRDVHYTTSEMPQVQVKGDKVFYVPDSRELYSGYTEDGSLELLHALPEKDRLLDYAFTESGYYLLVYEVGSLEQQPTSPQIELYLGKLDSHSFKKVRKLNVEQNQTVSGYRYRAMMVSPDERYLAICAEVNGHETFQLLELKDLSRVDVQKSLTEQKITLGESQRFLAFGGSDVIFFESVQNNDLCLHRYNVNAGTHDSLILASIRGTYYQIDPATGKGFVTGRSASTGAPFYFALSTEVFGDDGIGQFWD